MWKLLFIAVVVVLVLHEIVTRTLMARMDRKLWAKYGAIWRKRIINEKWRLGREPTDEEVKSLIRPEMEMAKADFKKNTRWYLRA